MGFPNAKNPKTPFLFPSSSSKNPTTSSDTDENPHPHNPTIPMVESHQEPLPPLTISDQDQDHTVLTQEEVLRRRSRRLRQLERFYKDQYWAMMEEVRGKYRDYYWKYGKSPFQEQDGGVGEGGEKLGLGFKEIDGFVKKCVFPACKSKPMALTNYCHMHILADPKQKLYKPCTYVVKSAQNGPVRCGKPILITTVPSLCATHFQKAQTHVTRALKKAGLGISSSNTLAPKFHLIVTESVRQINAKRRERRAIEANSLVNEEKERSLSVPNVVVKQEKAS